MPRYFFDTSALIKLYHREDGTDTVDELVDHDQSLIVILGKSPEDICHEILGHIQVTI